MPEIIETVVYRINELDEGARDKARDWYRQHGFDYDWYDFIFSDFEEICRILGITLKSSPMRRVGGTTRDDPHIFFRGFSSQGDGACFEGSYAYAPRARADIRVHAPQDAELHGIADCLQDVQRRNFYQLNAGIRHSGHYYHDHSMEIAVDRNSPISEHPSGDAEGIVVEAMRALARWLYRQLEREYERMSSDEVIDATLRANDYTFTVTGRRFG